MSDTNYTTDLLSIRAFQRFISLGGCCCFCYQTWGRLPFAPRPSNQRERLPELRLCGSHSRWLLRYACWQHIRLHHCFRQHRLAVPSWNQWANGYLIVLWCIGLHLVWWSSSTLLWQVGAWSEGLWMPFGMSFVPFDIAKLRLIYLNTLGKSLKWSRKIPIVDRENPQIFDN